MSRPSAPAASLHAERAPAFNAPRMPVLAAFAALAPAQPPAAPRKAFTDWAMI